jgi:hypothetical protein
MAGKAFGSIERIMILDEIARTGAHEGMADNTV